MSRFGIGFGIFRSPGLAAGGVSAFNPANLTWSSATVPRHWWHIAESDLPAGAHGNGGPASVDGVLGCIVSDARCQRGWDLHTGSGVLRADCVEITDGAGWESEPLFVGDTSKARGGYTMGARISISASGAARSSGILAGVDLSPASVALTFGGGTLAEENKVIALGHVAAGTTDVSAIIADVAESGPLTYSEYHTVVLTVVPGETPGDVTMKLYVDSDTPTDTQTLTGVSSALAFGRDRFNAPSNSLPSRVKSRFVAAQAFDDSGCANIRKYLENGSGTEGTLATLNPVDKGVSLTLDATGLIATAGGASWVSARSTVAHTTGVYYWEQTFVSGDYVGVGIAAISANMESYLGEGADSVMYLSNGTFYYGGSGGSYGSSFAPGDVIGVVLNLNARTIAFFKNGVSQGAAQSLSTFVIDPYHVTTCSIYAAAAVYAGAVTSLNFGATTFAHPENIPVGANAGWFV